MPVTNSPVLVTGVTGFIGAEVAKRLLEEGYPVRGTTRDPDRARQEGHVSSLPGAKDRLELIGADLLDTASIEKAMIGCDYVMHVASPYVLNVKDVNQDLIEPAVNGTTSVLEAASKSAGVKRVILTSSLVAMMGEGDDKPITEEDWNVQASPTNNPYAYSKVRAERAAWQFVEEEKPPFDLVVINPSIVIGPTLIPQANQSHEWFVSYSNGSAPAVIAHDFPGVDVRDVALAHVRAMERPDASGRYVTSASNFNLAEMVEIGRQLGMGEKYSLPRLRFDRGLGVPLSRRALFAQPSGTRAWLRAVLGKRFSADNSKVRAELGIDFRDMAQTIKDTWLDLDRWGLLGKKSRVTQPNK